MTNNSPDSPVSVNLSKDPVTADSAATAEKIGRFEKVIEAFAGDDFKNILGVIKTATDQDFSKALKRVEDQAKEIAEIEKQVDARNVRIERLENEVKQLNSRIKERENDIATLKAQIKLKTDKDIDDFFGI